MSDQVQPDWIEEPWWRSEPCNWGICNEDPNVLVVQIAIANRLLPDIHPLKITRADVRLLRAIAEDYEFRGTSDNEDLNRLAAKLAALLPPEDA